MSHRINLLILKSVFLFVFLVLNAIPTRAASSACVSVFSAFELQKTIFEFHREEVLNEFLKEPVSDRHLENFNRNSLLFEKVKLPKDLLRNYHDWTGDLVQDSIKFFTASGYREVNHSITNKLFHNHSVMNLIGTLSN